MDTGFKYFHSKLYQLSGVNNDNNNYVAICFHLFYFLFRIIKKAFRFGRLLKYLLILIAFPHSCEIITITIIEMIFIICFFIRVLWYK